MELVNILENHVFAYKCAGTCVIRAKLRTDAVNIRFGGVVNFNELFLKLQHAFRGLYAKVVVMQIGGMVILRQRFAAAADLQ